MSITEPGITMAAAPEAGTDRYRDALASLRGARSGEGRAALIEVMAAEAGSTAAITYGVVPAGSRDSSLAWEMTAVLLRQLAAAQRGLVLHMVGDWDAEHADAASEWEDLARARKPREFAAAFAAVRGELLRELESQEQDGPSRRAVAGADPGHPAASALARLAEAACAISEACWQE